VTARKRRPTSNLQPPTSSTGRVWLVGAGPGDPGLITLAGLEALRAAEVVVYDRLVSPRLPDHAPASAERIYVGKTPKAVILSEAKNLGEPETARHPESPHDQAAINQLLVEKARAGKRVVRLKGGDPFIFGRGGEEAEALAAAGLPFVVVPGVTSSVAVPAYAGIPVTHRGVASSFAVVTGHEAEDVILSGDDDLSRRDASSRRDPGRGSARTERDAKDAVDWAKLATAVDTLVLLMGVRTLPAIIEKLIAAGRPGGTPAAIIQRGTTPGQRTVTGTLGDIVARAQDAGIGPPAITVVGEAVRLRDAIAWFEDRPLFGKRVLITRTRRQASVLARLLADEGAVPIELPAIEIEPSYDDGAVAAAAERLRAGGYAWCVFTSANAVDIWFDLLRERGLDARAFGGTRVAAIGPATARALAARGITADAVPDEYVAEAVVETLRVGAHGHAPIAHGDRILLPRAESARLELVDGLRGLGAQVDEVTLYRAALPGEAPAEALALLRDRGIDIVTFTSSSTVRNLAALLDGDLSALGGEDAGGPAPPLSHARERGLREAEGVRARPLVACIGPITAATARDLGLRVDVVATEHTVPGLVAELRGHYGGGHN
jgi:uroporphyrinogen III methyltransferase/synthase